MISNTLLQKALIARMKANAGIITVLGGTNEEIREQQWQGRTFTYPAIRLALHVQVPETELEPCEWFILPFSVLCLSEKKSSEEADRLAGAVNVCFHKKAWDEVADSFRFHMIRSTGLNSAIRMSERVWKAEASFRARLHTL